MYMDNKIMYQQDKNIYLKNIKKTSSKVFLVLFLMNILAIISLVIVIQVIKIMQVNFGINFSDQFIKFSNLYLPYIISELILIPIAFLLLRDEIDISWFNVFSKNNKLSSDIKDITRFKVLSVFSVFGINFIVIQIISIMVFVLGVIGYNINIPNISFSNDTVSNILVILYLCVIAPIFEEILLRGFVLNSFKKYGDMTAILISSIAFAMVHMNIVQIPIGFLIGLLLGFVTIKTGNIRLAIIIHISNNLLNTLPTYLFGKNNGISMIFIITLMLTGLLILAIFIILYRRKFTDLYKNESREYASMGKKFLYTILTVTSMLFIVQWIINNILFILQNVVKK